MKSVDKWIKLALMAVILVAAIGKSGHVATAQDSPSTTVERSTFQGKSKKKTRRIIILGTTITGAVAGPRVIYDVPWKEPDSFRKGLAAPERSFYDEIFSPLDLELPKSQREPLH